MEEEEGIPVASFSERELELLRHGLMGIINITYGNFTVEENKEIEALYERMILL